MCGHISSVTDSTKRQQTFALIIQDLRKPLRSNSKTSPIRSATPNLMVLTFLLVGSQKVVTKFNLNRFCDFYKCFKENQLCQDLDQSFEI